MAAVVAHGNRGPALEALETPALVIHGSTDPLVHPEGGRDTHRALRNSELLMVEGMGHDLPVGAWDDIIRTITLHTANHH
jgi:pimeloyl-ACP methyl ester carboxylesterase